jgi:hypothetical protein
MFENYMNWTISSRVSLVIKKKVQRLNEIFLYCNTNKKKVIATKVVEPDIIYETYFINYNDIVRSLWKHKEIYRNDIS